MCVFRQSHSEEVSQLQEQLSERTRENKRLKSSFNSIKELNDNMKKQASICFSWLLFT